MKLKKIEDGMVVHCSTEDEAKELIKWAYECGFGWSGVAEDSKTNFKVNGKNTCYCFTAEFITYTDTCFCNKNSYKFTEFSNLIIPEESEHMSAEEVLNWFIENYYNTTICTETFGEDYSFRNFKASNMSTKEIISKIESYEAKKKQEKEVEVEWVSRVFNKKENKNEFYYDMGDAEQRCIELVKNGEQEYATFETVCRLKK
jgi:hypothetical protein